MINLNNRVQYSKLAFLILAWIFTVCLVAQTFIAGLAIFNSSSHWVHHTTFVVWFQFLPIIMLVLSFTGQFPKLIRWKVVGLFLLIVPLQYMSVNILGLGAIHPVIALVLFWLALNVIKNTEKI
ncbi:hypothetical protein GI584_06490 [Gracilibacillus salitolerans]|uniref:Uncharacterized protein n=1 Tax=Gracilibacillus salitolerans TaxID=2663022 RepID=A0A5Q2TG90_9BACI|nr:DUF6220 domain-containing protein [Gracilibacillus salitolerans]QGH33686.1 hypothetical protein GI584_06490 [Gracilibacillus salitolerans]